MLEALARNYSRARGTAAVRLYEIATEYLPGEDGKLPREGQSVILGMYGGDTDFFSAKGVAGAVLERARVAGWEAVPVTDDPTFHPGRCCALMLGEVRLGVIGQAHPAVCENYRVDTPLYLASLDVEALRAHAGPEPQFRPLPRFPVSTRDLALVCDEAVTNGQIRAAMIQAGGKLLDSCALFDVYRSPQLGEGKKSLAYALTLRADDRTLTDEECDRAVEKILKALAGMGVALRK
jgi:phenylalanyl-tRNA synthetase beta chain